MTKRRVGILMNGVTGRMGRIQHLARAIMAIREDGGIPLGDGHVIWPEPTLVGRNEAKLRALAEAHGLERWTTDLDAALANPDIEVYFDAQVTSRRTDALKAALAAGKHVYCEKPSADTLDDAIELARRAREAGIKNGVVQDKLFLPGFLKLKRLIDGGFFGRILSVRGDFGYWVFEGDWQPAQRPSWNYRAEDGGGIILDMLAHWRYVLDHLFGQVRAVSCLGATHLPDRVDEAGHPYRTTADDAAYAMFRLDGDVIAQVNSSWCVRVYRDDLVTFQVDGTHGSAVAGLHTCRVQHRSMTPKPVWNPDAPGTHDYRDDWHEVPDNGTFDNGFKTQWVHFLEHVVSDAPFPHTLLEGAKGVQLAELGMRSWREGRWLDVPELSA
ncbi:MAG: Gfo/Idh/MocA family oxidoreductase [Trueperaceae bacterium]|nr:Gfo/Idh/MocA family oxidoreductase [Trueperaceae bacterium]